jgi:hypothetical protein
VSDRGDALSEAEKPVLGQTTQPQSAAGRLALIRKSAAKVQLSGTRRLGTNTPTRAYRREYRDRMLGSGRCLDCGDRATDDRQRCDTCCSKRNELRRARPKLGLCTDCAKPRINRRHCEEHAGKYRVKRAEDRKRLRAEGLCDSCRQPKDRVGERCTKCHAVRAKTQRERIQRQRAEWQSAGMCIRCGKLPKCEGIKECEVCRAVRRREYERRKAKKAAHANR